MKDMKPFEEQCWKLSSLLLLSCYILFCKATVGQKALPCKNANFICQLNKSVCFQVANYSLRSDRSPLYPQHIIAISCIIAGAELMNREKDIKVCVNVLLFPDKEPQQM